MRVWLHIGLHKTGTTALQFWFRDQEERLHEEGLLYVRERNHRPACGGLALGLANATPDVPAMIDRVVGKIAASGAADALLSSEAFAAYPAEGARPLLDALADHDLRVVLWLRRQDRLAEALYKQVVKANGFFGGLESFLNLHVAGILDFERVLTEWADVLGGRPLLPQIYEEAEEAGPPDSIKSMLTVIGRPDLVPEESERHRVNITPSAELVRFYESYSGEKLLPMRRANRRVMAEFADVASGRADLFSPKVARDLRARYAEANERLRQRWFPDRPSLFAPPQDAPILARKVPEEVFDSFRRYLREEEAKA